MPLHLITGPAHSGKSDYLIGKVRELLNESPVLLVPTGNDVQMWRQRLIDALGVLTFARVETFGSFTRELYRRLDAGSPILSAGGMQLLVSHVIEHERESLGPLKKAAERGGFAATLTRIIGEMETCGLTPAGLRATMASHPESLFYGNDVLLLFDAYQRRLAELGSTDSQLASAITADGLAQATILWQAPILLAGFADFTPAEDKLLRSLSEGAEVYVALTYSPDDPLLAFARGPVERLAEAASSTEVMPANSPPATEYRFLSAGGRRGEIELTGSLVAGRLRSGTPPDSIGVVARDISAYAGLIADVFTTYHIPFTSAEHLPLRLTSLGAAVLSLLSCLSGAAGSLRADLTAVLRSPYSGALSETVDEFDHLARRHGISDRASLMDLIDETEVLGPSSMLREILTRAPRGGPDLAHSLKELLPQMWLNAHTRAGSESTDSAKQALQDTGAARLMGEELAYAAEFAEHAGVTLTPTVITELINKLRLNVSSSSDGGAVRVTDAADCHAFSFREVYILGLNQQEFPRLGEEDPFFDDAERRLLAETSGAALPLRANEPDRERYLFYQALTRGSETVYLSRRYCDADGRDEAESFYSQDIRAGLEARGVSERLIERSLGDVTLPLELAPTGDELRRSLAANFPDPEYRDIAKDAGMLMDIERAASRQTFRGPALTAATTLAALRGRSRFGATELEAYLACPFKWFVERLVRPVSMTPDSKSLLTGRLAHTILAGALPDALRGEEEIGAILARRIDEAMAGLGDGDQDVIQTRVTAARLLAMLTPFMESEPRRLSASVGFVPRLFEHSFGAEDEHEVRLSEDVVLTGRLDRLDQGPDNSAFVIDYKTGKVGSGNIGDFEKNSLLQGLLYSKAAQQALGYEPVGCGYYSLKEQKWKSLAVAEVAASLNMGRECISVSREVFDANVSAAVAKALEAIGQMRSGDISLSAKDDICGFCDKSVCRVAQEPPEAAWS